MEEKIEFINNEINLRCNLLVKDNKFLIDGYKNRLIMRLVNIYKKYKVPFNKDIITLLFDENLLNIIIDSNNTSIDSFRKVLEGYNEIINKYVDDNYDKNKIKQATSSFMIMINDKIRPLNKNITMNFLEAIMSKTEVYDIYALNVEITDRIKDDTKSLIEEINSSNKRFICDMMKFILEKIFNK